MPAWYAKAFLITFAISPVLCGRSLAQQRFHSLGCGSGCSVDYFALKGPYSGSDGLRKILVREINTHGGAGGTPLTRETKQVWILADCNPKNKKINLSSQSSSGRGSHADASGWDSVNYDNGTNYENGIREIYAKLCNIGFPVIAEDRFADIPKTTCVMTKGTVITTFPCSLKGLSNLEVAITNLLTGERYHSGEGGEWARGRSCLYREGHGNVCTKAAWQKLD